MLNTFLKYLTELKRKAREYESTKVIKREGDKHPNFINRNFRILFCFFVAFSLVLTLKSGLNDQFIDQISTLLSIFIGLFITSLIFGYDKFYQKKAEGIETNSATENLRDKAYYNFTKIFTNITGYSIVLSVYCLVLLGLHTLFTVEVSINIYDYEFILENFQFKQHFKPFLVNSAVFLLRFFILYLFLSVLYNTLYVISSMLKFMNEKNKKA